MFELIPGSEMSGVIRHVDHSPKFTFPRISVVRGMSDQNGNVGMDELGDFRITPTSKRRECPRIWTQSVKVFRCHHVDAIGFVEILDRACVCDALRTFCEAPNAA